jgi:uncharacterized protein (TIGR00255 family)
MIKSMTAYAASENSDAADFKVCCEIRSLNSRYLDIKIKIPEKYIFLENDIKRKIEKEICRGRIDVKIDIKNNSEENIFFDIDEKKALSYHNALIKLQNFLSIDEKISLSLLPIDEIIIPIDTYEDIETLKKALKESLDSALFKLNEMRITEGAFLEKEFQKRLDIISQSIKIIKAKSKGLINIYQKKLLERIEKLTTNEVEIDKMRIAQEAAILADKSDITEEITRGFSHINQFQNIMSENEPSGKKLNFLVQEFNREFNTIGAKSSNSEILYKVVELKAELEKIREQVQNIE